MLTVLLKRPSHANSQATSTPTKDKQQLRRLQFSWEEVFARLDNKELKKQ